MPNKDQFPSKPCTIETIDTGFVEHLEKEFNIHVYTNSGFRKVPIIWVGSERSFQTKADASLRDTAGKLILPVITVQRTSMQKDPSFKGAVQANMIPNVIKAREHAGGSFLIASNFNQEKTAALQASLNSNERNPDHAFGELANTQIVLDQYLVPVPVYTAITYSITLRCEYQQQMNQMMLPFLTKTGQINCFIIKKDGHRFESFIQQDFAASNNLDNMSEDERKFQTKIDVKVLGYLIGQGINEERPKVVRRETIATLSVAVESLLVEEEEEEETATTRLYRMNQPNYVYLNGKCYVKKRIVTLSEPDSSTGTSTTGGDSGAFSSDATSITDLIENARKGVESNFRLGEVSVELGASDEYVETEDDDCS